MANWGLRLTPTGGHRWRNDLLGGVLPQAVRRGSNLQAALRDAAHARCIAIYSLKISPSNQGILSYLPIDTTETTDTMTCSRSER